MTTTKDREPGFYHVRVKDCPSWTIGEYGDGSPHWDLPGIEVCFDDEHFAEIGPRVTPPTEPKGDSATEQGENMELDLNQFTESEQKRKWSEEHVDRWYCVDCYAPLILKKNCTVKDETKLRCYSCWSKLPENERGTAKKFWENIQKDMQKYDIPPDPNKKFPSAMYWMKVLIRRAFRDAGSDNYEDASDKWFKENEPLIGAHMDQYVTELQMKPERFGANGFWADKDNNLKTVVWALDRKIWPLVFAEEATHSWGRQESAKLILEYIESLKTRKP